MKKRIWWLGNIFCVLIFFWMIFNVGCGPKARRQLLDAETHFEIAKKYFDDEDYLKASDEFSIIIYQFSGSAIIDDAQYYLAECHFMMKEYIIAVDEYQRLVRNYTESEWADDSQNKIGLAYFKLSPKSALDQEYTANAIKAFQTFLDEFPNSELRPDVEKHLQKSREKLARKDFDNAQIYRKMQYYNAAIIYLDLILKEYYDTKYTEYAEYWKPYCYFKLDDYEKAIKGFKAFLKKYPNSQFKEKANEHLRKAQSHIPAEESIPDTMRTSNKY